MSDPVQNSDVEDVLSSIRRLVSEEDRPAAKAPEPAPSDRLVLTPSLRVAEPAEQESAPAEAPEAATPEEHVEDAPAEEAQPEGDAHPEDAAPEAEAEEVAEPSAEDDQADEAAHEPDVAEAEHAEPETAEWSEADEAEAEAEPEQEPEPEHASEPEPEPDTEEAYATPQSLSAKIAALEEVIARRDDQWEPDTAGSDDYAGTEDADMAWEDAGADDLGGDPEGPEIFAIDEDVLDEDALRDLVADIVREELQGALGERITRNVRKLVRREIHRALAAQELD